MARLLFFGKLGDLAGGRLRDQVLPEGVTTVGQLIYALGMEDPTLGEALLAPSIRFVVNENMAAGDAAISDVDEIAFLPPVSGG